MSLHIEKQKSGNNEYLRLVSLKRMKSSNGRLMIGKKTIVSLGALAKIWPTLVCCVVGGALAGVAAHFAKKVVPAWRDDEKK